MIASKRKGHGMATSSDLWYIQLPDGRVLHARSTNALRRHLKRGRIPRDSLVRSSTDSPWQTLDQTPEFADLNPRESESHAAPSVQTKAPEPDMHGVIKELCFALDTSLHRPKLTTAALAGLAIGITLLSADRTASLWSDWMWAGRLGSAFALILEFSICSCILTQMTALELSRSRPALVSEIRAGLFGYILRLSFALSLIGGAMLGLIVLLRAVPGWITPVSADEIGMGLETFVNVIQGTRMLVEVICWPIFALALLLGPILIVDDHSIWRGLREWLRLLRTHLGRIYRYQTITFAFAAVMTLPLLVPVLLAGANPSSVGEAAIFYLLFGLALTPGLAYLMVAQVFIYLNLRYEFFYSARER